MIRSTQGVAGFTWDRFVVALCACQLPTLRTAVEVEKDMNKLKCIQLDVASFCMDGGKQPASGGPELDFPKKSGLFYLKF